MQGVYKTARFAETWGARTIHKNTATKVSKARRNARKPGPVTIIRPSK